MDVAVYSDENVSAILTSTSLGFNLSDKVQHRGFMSIAEVRKHSFAKNLGPVLYRDGVTNWT